MARLVSVSAISSSCFGSALVVRPVIPIARALSTKMEAAEHYEFGPYKIDQREVFYSTPLSYAFVNLRPLLPGNLLIPHCSFFSRVISLYLSLCGSVCYYKLYLFPPIISFCLVALTINKSHVLVCPKRQVKRFVDLTAEETSDLWTSAQNIGNQLENYHKASSLTFAIQDGPQAGQTVPHVHIHIVPRKGGDFDNNDEIYDAIDEKEKELKHTLDLDKERKDRSMDEMAQEADEYRKLFSLL
ncbi:hypothetical protein M8C21_029019 [Ambrosia artemisiifolia]|uniref:Bis(5'-adenosyl)-triphosphatase n=1 Tax=Ambrosia artemisiifolia TaxID=4212 RepID=A0AAD5CWA3_AMBAR|nr:hypothetical protein M8C21_029019 [Ambrosia artemisiifolia]